MALAAFSPERQGFDTTGGYLPACMGKFATSGLKSIGKPDVLSLARLLLTSMDKFWPPETKGFWHNAQFQAIFEEKSCLP